MSKKLIATILTYAGTIPFIFIAILSTFKPDVLGVSSALLLMSYGAVIVSFISGTHWSIYLLKDIPINLFIRSNIITLFAWISVILLNTFSPFILIICLLYLLYIDQKLEKINITSDWYLQMRMIATIIVSTALGIFWLF